MAIRKEIIVLNGGGHKGVVKISGVNGRDNYAKISCSLDFRPSGAFLYVVGDTIAKIALKDVNQEVEVPFCANNNIGCVVRSSSLTMFGGRGVKSAMLSKIDQFNRKDQSVIQSASARAGVAGDCISNCKNADNIAESAIMCDDKSAGEERVRAMAEENETVLTDAEVGIGEMEDSQSKRESRPFAGAATHSSVNPLDEWTKYDGNNFYYAIKPQIDEMFICYPEEKLLGETVPNSKWVRVDADDGYYVVGLLYDDDSPSYICYGVPQLPIPDKMPRRAPVELENMCVWLPLTGEEEIEGYWMIYQSAKTGEIIK